MRNSCYTPLNRGHITASSSSSSSRRIGGCGINVGAVSFRQLRNRRCYTPLNRGHITAVVRIIGGCVRSAGSTVRFISTLFSFSNSQQAGKHKGAATKDGTPKDPDACH
mmetsp:Transcript_9713/g.14248  ORF Transcript_9713/g.14248 Transcript_9713/m.14248 type:complete len:109 (-) Transcript_9713:2125-2451(-)